MPKVTVRRVGVLSLAKIYGVTLAVIGLIVGVIYGLIMMVVSAFVASSGAQGSGFGAIGGVVGGLAFMIIFPIFYGLLGFVGGAIAAAVYNFAAGYIGGLELELEGAGDTMFTAPPPPQWAPNPYQSANS